MASQDWFDKDFYKVLGVAKDVSESDLKKTYRKLARQYHPDSNAGDAKAEARFKEISEAYSVLSDPEQRTEYDQVRAMGSGARFTSGAGGAPGGFEDVFGSMFSGGNRRAGAGAPYGQNGFEDLLGANFPDVGLVALQIGEEHRVLEINVHVVARLADGEEALVGGGLRPVGEGGVV